jgi:gamma-glutamylcyclotransferase (GGCT)/AIG2-like uncharacterized protein YtfP
MGNERQLVFVYGTLRKGEINHNLLESSEFIGGYVTEPKFELHDLGEYPGLVEGTSSIVGEVYRVNDETLAQLDILEDVPIEYRRELIDTPYGPAHYYIYQGQVQGSDIHGGDWMSRFG